MIANDKILFFLDLQLLLKKQILNMLSKNNLVTQNDHFDGFIQYTVDKLPTDNQTRD